MFRTLLSAAAALTCVSPALAQTPRQSAPITDVQYEITADSASVGRHQLGATMSFHVNSAAPVVLAIPAWSPGHYTLLWFARRVSQFSAQSNGTPLEWKKLDFQTWEIKPRAAGTVRVSFNYLADAVDRVERFRGGAHVVLRACSHDLRAIAARLPALGSRTELIFVEGHSTDDTLAECHLPPIGTLHREWFVIGALALAGLGTTCLACWRRA